MPPHLCSELADGLAPHAIARLHDPKIDPEFAAHLMETE
jgi:hypothetical protein